MVSGLTQKEIAKLYDVPVGSLSSTYREMDDELEEEIRKIIEISLEEDELDNPLPAFPFNPLKGPMATSRPCRKHWQRLRIEILKPLKK